MPAGMDLPRLQRGSSVRGHVRAGEDPPIDPRDHVRRNVAVWTGFAPGYAERAPRNWARAEITWGIWDVPESRVNALGEVAGIDVVELGCGTAYFSAWLARRGARPVGIDPTPAQLATAKAMQDRFGLFFPLIEASAEEVPLADERFDLALSEYGASIWCDPYRWIPEAARLLRPGGRLVFLGNTAIMMLTADELGNVGEHLNRDYFGMHRFEWPDDHSVEFHLGYGDWIRLLRANSFTVEGLIELQAPPGAWSALDHIPPGWAERWPTEEIWIARKPSS
jgi:SAM-dependent methyltransferase